MKFLHVCTIVLGLVPVVAWQLSLPVSPFHGEALAAENTTTPRQGVSNSPTVGNPTYSGQKTDRIYNQVAPTGSGEYPGGEAACRARGHGSDYCYVHCGNNPANRDLCGK
ncbi:MAG TPA: hypothetical protein VGK96_04910 [Candidatus Sulfotelmatobacter sp.]